MDRVTPEGPNSLSGCFMPTVNEADEKLSIAACSEHWQITKEAEYIFWDRYAVLSYCIVSVDPEWSLQVSKSITIQLTPYSIVFLEEVNGRSRGHEIPRIFWVHILPRSQQPITGPVISRMNLVYIVTSDLYKSNLILPSGT
jgi:hypothetical protein